VIKRTGGRRTRTPNVALVVAVLGLSLAVGAHVAPTPVEAAVTPGCVVDVTDMIGWWRGQNDLVGTTGPALTGTVPFVDGMVGRGMSFDGSSAVGTDLLPTVSTAVSVETWVKPATTAFTGHTQALMSRWDLPSTDDHARAFELLLDPFNNLVWSTDESGAQRPVELRAPAPQFADGGFHHVAATWNQATIALYIDGAQVASMPSQGGVLNTGASTGFRLGSEVGLGTPLPFNGVLDEPTVWARSLSAQEVTAIHSAGFSGKCTFVPVEQSKLAGSSTIANDRFGSSLGVDGSTTITGAPFSSVRTQFAGAAYVHVLQGTAWNEQATLTASDAALVDFFGNSVDVDGDTAVVGAYASNTGGTDAGAAYVFTRTGTTWTQQAKLVASDPTPNAQFGYSVAIDGDTIVVGSPFADPTGLLDAGTAYVFTRSGTVWTEQARLAATAPVAGDLLGVSVAIDVDTIVAGAPATNGNGIDSGSAVVYTRSAGTWAVQGSLTAADAAAADYFGYSVALAGDVVAVGTPFDDDQGVDSGSAYVDSRIAGVWGQDAKLLPSTPSTNAQFGHSVGFNGASIVVGAPSALSAGLESGGAFVFSRSTGPWAELVSLIPADLAPGDQFGGAVAIALSGNLVIGANLADSPGSNRGAVYLFAS
jgi:hypothetical protein